jgi:hypothetical protein
VNSTRGSAVSRAFCNGEYTDDARGEILHAAGWVVNFSGSAPNAQSAVAEPEVVIYDVGPGPLSDDFAAFCAMKFFPLLALVADWDAAMVRHIHLRMILLAFETTANIITPKELPFGLLSGIMA